MAKKSAAAIDVDAILGVAAASSAEAKSASKVPHVSGYEDIADEIVKLYKQAEDAEAAFRKKEADLISQVNALYEKYASQGNFSKSFNIAGDDTPGVQVTYRDQFTSIPAEKEPELKSALGADYELFFKKSRDISVKVTDDDTVKLLISKLGKEDFLRIFDVKLNVLAKPDMDRKQFNLPAPVRECLRQYKPGVKIIK